MKLKNILEAQKTVLKSGGMLIIQMQDTSVKELKLL